MNSRFVDWLLSIAGQKLVTVLALIYSYDEEKDFLNPQELDLQFQFRGHGKLSCSADGSSIDWQGTNLSESDLGDYGKQTIENISEESIWRNVTNKTLESVKLINSTVERCTIGIRFLFEGGIGVSVVNLGDELYVYDHIPEEVVDEQGVTLSDLV